jgi:hypothetical protein
MRRYDSYEPDDQITPPSTISLGTTLKADILDGKDQDHFMIKTPANVTKLDIFLEYLSGTLQPHLAISGSNYNLVQENSGYG